ncbi:adenosine receptor A2a isoform X2 [Cinclus cinclus]|uniref:adenosine receptor A2a isoform X2 n=1 Tax=Cinclus cinclus TaxID=127875 RepID=UPI002E0E4F8A
MAVPKSFGGEGAGWGQQPQGHRRQEMCCVLGDPQPPTRWECETAVKESISAESSSTLPEWQCTGFLSVGSSGSWEEKRVKLLCVCSLTRCPPQHCTVPPSSVWYSCRLRLAGSLTTSQDSQVSALSPPVPLRGCCSGLPVLAPSPAVPGHRRPPGKAAGLPGAHPIPSHPIPSHPIPSHPIPSHPIPSHPIPPGARPGAGAVPVAARPGAVPVPIPVAARPGAVPIPVPVPVAAPHRPAGGAAAAASCAEAGAERGSAGTAERLRARPERSRAPRPDKQSMFSTTSLLEGLAVVVLLGNAKSGDFRDLKLIPYLKTQSGSSSYLSTNISEAKGNWIFILEEEQVSFVCSYSMFILYIVNY